MEKYAIGLPWRRCSLIQMLAEHSSTRTVATGFRSAPDIALVVSITTDGSAVFVTATSMFFLVLFIKDWGRELQIQSTNTRIREDECWPGWSLENHLVLSDSEVEILVESVLPSVTPNNRDSQSVPPVDSLGFGRLLSASRIHFQARFMSMRAIGMSSRLSDVVVFH